MEVKIGKTKKQRKNKEKKKQLRKIKKIKNLDPKLPYQKSLFPPIYRSATVSHADKENQKAGGRKPTAESGK